MKIEVVGHHGRANDPDCDVEHAGLAETGIQKGMAEFEEAGLCLRQNEDLDEVAGANRRNQ